MGNRYFEVLERASSFLEKQGKEGYSILFVFLERKGWSKTDWLLHLKEEMPETEQQQVQVDVERLAENYPPQYLLGYSDFYDHRFLVTENTLIPRPETEELVDRCIKENPDQRLTVVDVGTGTAAIAISLKLARPNWQVSAIDISEEALVVAKKNAQNLAADISFIHGDGLKPVRDEAIDILISNPPYISNAEWELMDESVRTFEPKKALFAENDGLAIYQQLANEAKNCLKSTGKIYLEIGFQQGKVVQALFQHAFPKYNVQIFKDLSGNDRMVIVSPE
ncbi:peptide chain release factor N(5)-glutamine methyltransferase [Enterococcus sp. 5H]|uniref:peptide chain release factor N(5)-glutamine methyltransferase n=1 Tax=Enterococcus sp. 5H TaxID=1229490 RepID=UPI0023022347|nr:peptide chain release factor N(5)-glutamine methyltransferase [Enterococcus sp. 5H]MDA9470888.1 Methylase of polypeptide chain release factor [Enterococcus sp. 5H]